MNVLLIRLESNNEHHHLSVLSVFSCAEKMMTKILINFKLIIRALFIDVEKLLKIPM